MSITAEKLVDEALNLPIQVRAFVAEKLIESLDEVPGATLSPAWEKEIKKRCQEIDQGLIELRSAEDVFTKAYAAL
ncbi:MAG: addiction module protein [Kiritimatiellales bacterium]|nr:addiction module protein [Kiritimatiellota bacterium]MBL7011445.1 addiction module protein [Kiritimatiellales bacterium]